MILDRNFLVLAMDSFEDRLVESCLDAVELVEVILIRHGLKIHPELVVEHEMAEDLVYFELDRVEALNLKQRQHLRLLQTLLDGFFLLPLDEIRVDDDVVLHSFVAELQIITKNWFCDDLIKIHPGSLVDSSPFNKKFQLQTFQFESVNLFDFFSDIFIVLRGEIYHFDGI